MNRPIRIAVVDPHPLYRQGVVQTVIRSADLVLVAEGEGVADARRVVHEGGIDILVLDVAIFDGAAKGAEELARKCIDCKLVVLTAHDDLLTVSAALAAGVRGYILKGVSGSELVAAIKMVHAGQPFITPELASRMLVEDMSTLRTAKRMALSVRERQVLNHLSRGHTNKEIAELLGLQVKTIKFHLSTLFKKLNVTNRVQAMKTARELKINFEQTQS
jgi:two-component system, NarL family, nitrate/nitrite response regulator NarL